MWFLFFILVLPLSVHAEYLGELSVNPYNPESTVNPYGAGSTFKPGGINNPFLRPTIFLDAPLGHTAP